MWQRKAADEWSSFRPLVREGVVWVGNGQGELVALDLDDGTRRRVVKLTGAIRGFEIVDGVFYVGTLDGPFYAVKP